MDKKKKNNITLKKRRAKNPLDIKPLYQFKHLVWMKAPDVMRKGAELLDILNANPEILTLVELAHAGGLYGDVIKEWEHRIPEFKMITRMCREILGVRRYKLCAKNQLNFKVISTTQQYYDDEYKAFYNDQREQAGHSNQAIVIQAPAHTTATFDDIKPAQKRKIEGEHEY